ncbi:MAG TPA: di-heme oxidoredictase family protein [Polyangiaceae bacterium]|nr:di-heme oxidoredictase family protein [Polyangiaceae bacterium]
MPGRRGRFQSGRLLLPMGALVFACGQPELTRAEPDPAERLPGGETTNTLLLGSNAFTRPVSNITREHEIDFHTGNSFFSQAWVQAPASTEARDGLGPLFNARACSACHFKDGRGSPPLGDDEEFLGILLRLSVPGAEPGDEPRPDPDYGGQLQPFAISGVEPEGKPRVSYEELRGEYADGEEYSLLEPRFEVLEFAYGTPSSDLMISPRVAPVVFGLGLLEAIPEERLDELADPNDTDADGISGRLNHVPDAESSRTSVGRFGWKAEQPSVRQQAAAAFLGDMGITTSLFTQQDCTDAQADCGAAIAGGDPEISDDLLDTVSLYTSLLAVPVRSGWDDPEVLEGQKLFGALGCDGCHVPRHVTGDHEFEELSGQVIFPYTDLLLHDMGRALSDERPSFGAEGNEWRTPPLWGLGRLGEVNGHDRLLHDGRARGVAEAVLWHGGEAEASRDAFSALSRAERDALVRFVESL